MGRFGLWSGVVGGGSIGWDGWALVGRGVVFVLRCFRVTCSMVDWLGSNQAYHRQRVFDPLLPRASCCYKASTCRLCQCDIDEVTCL